MKKHRSQWGKHRLRPMIFQQSKIQAKLYMLNCRAGCVGLFVAHLSFGRMAHVFVAPIGPGRESTY